METQLGVPWQDGLQKKISIVMVDYMKSESLILCIQKLHQIPKTAVLN